MRIQTASFIDAITDKPLRQTLINFIFREENIIRNEATRKQIMMDKILTINHCLLLRLSHYKMEMAQYESLNAYIVETLNGVDQTNASFQDIRFNLCGHNMLIPRHLLLFCRSVSVFIYALWKEYAFLIGPNKIGPFLRWFPRWRNLTFGAFWVSLFIPILPYFSWIICYDANDNCTLIGVTWIYCYCTLEAILLILIFGDYLRDWIYLFHVLPFILVNKNLQSDQLWQHTLLNDAHCNISIMDNESDLFQHLEFVYYDIVCRDVRNKMVSQLLEDPISDIVMSYLWFDMNYESELVRAPMIYHEPNPMRH